MRVTKLEHAALLLEHEGRRIVIDPGNFTAPLPPLENVVAVVITHEHPDHWTPEQLERILRASPAARILSTPAVAEAARFPVQIACPGDAVEAGPFTLRFFGGQHAVIHSSIPVVDNLGVLVNEKLYYPGDSYALPEGTRIDTLAAPIGAPWLKIGEAMDFVLAAAPRRCFGTHEAPLSPRGLAMHRQRLDWATAQGGGEFFALDAGQTLELD